MSDEPIPPLPSSRAMLKAELEQCLTVFSEVSVPGAILALEAVEELPQGEIDAHLAELVAQVERMLLAWLDTDIGTSSRRMA